MIERLRIGHGPLPFFQSGGCCDGTSAICLKDGELPLGSGDVQLGEIGAAPFYIDADQYRRWGRPRFLIDVAPRSRRGVLARRARGRALRLASPRTGHDLAGQPE